MFSEYREEKSLTKVRSAEAYLPGYRGYSVCIETVSRCLYKYILEKHVSQYVYLYIFRIYLLRVSCVGSVCISRWCPTCMHFVSGQKLPHSGNAGLGLCVEYVLPTYNVNKMKKLQLSKV